MSFLNLADFGFVPDSDEVENLHDIPAGGKSTTKLMWTFYIYLSFALGLFLGCFVNNINDPREGINFLMINYKIVLAILCIALILLSPVMKMLSKVHHGKITFMHCLTAITIGGMPSSIPLLINYFMKMIGG